MLSTKLSKYSLKNRSIQFIRKSYARFPEKEFKKNMANCVPNNIANSPRTDYLFIFFFNEENQMKNIPSTTALELMNMGINLFEVHNLWFTAKVKN